MVGGAFAAIRVGLRVGALVVVVVMVDDYRMSLLVERSLRTEIRIVFLGRNWGFRVQSLLPSMCGVFGKCRRRIKPTQQASDPYQCTRGPRLSESLVEGEGDEKVPTVRIEFWLKLSPEAPKT